MLVRAQHDPAESQLALEHLCSTYWMPLYCWARHRGKSAPDAEDLVQSFLATLIQKDFVAQADRERGRFRDLLLAAFKQFLAREHRHDNAAKRAPEKPLISLDVENIELRLQQTGSPQRTAVEQFERDWAIALVNYCVGRLKAEYTDAGKGVLFETLRGYITENGSVSGREAAASLAISENAVRIAAFRMKKRLGAILQAELSQTLQSPSELAHELQLLISALEK